MSASKKLPTRNYAIEIELGGFSRLVTVDTFDVLTYECGLKAGESVKLKDALPVEDANGQVVREIPKGAVWTVLSGSSQDPGCLWLAEPGGEAHSWDDDSAIFEVFDRP